MFHHHDTWGDPIIRGTFHIFLVAIIWTFSCRLPSVAMADSQSLQLGHMLYVQSFEVGSELTG